MTYMSIKQLANYGKKKKKPWISNPTNHPSITSTFKNKCRFLLQPVGGAPLHTIIDIIVPAHLFLGYLIFKD